MIVPHRVIFGDTDQMGIVYYANYYRFFEAARAEYWRKSGRSYRDVEAAGFALPVVESQCFYRSPAHFEDLLDIHLEVSEVRGASFRFTYRILRGATLIAEGMTRHAVTTREGRPCAMPAIVREAIQQ